MIIILDHITVRLYCKNFAFEHGKSLQCQVEQNTGIDFYDIQTREIYAVNPCMLEHEGLVFNILRSFQQLPLQPLPKLLQTKFISLHFSMKQSMIFLVKVF